MDQGGVLNEMVNNIKLKLANNTDSQLFLFSSHDTYVAAMTKLLNLTDYIDQPPYASSVILELRKSIGTPAQYYVQAYLKNNTVDDDIKLQLFPINGSFVLFGINFL